MKRFARIPAVIMSAALLAASAPIQPSLASEGPPSVATPGNPCVPDVERQFRALKHHGEALGFRPGAGTPDPTKEKHYQGIQRLPGRGTPFFFVSKSGKPTNPVGTEQEAHLLVVRFGSRESDGERLRSNRLLRDRTTEQSPPPPSDEVVWDISYNRSGLEYSHAGGMQAYDDILAVPLDQPMSSSLPLPTGKVLFYDVSDPSFPLMIYELWVDHDAGAVALTKLATGHYFLAVGGPNNGEDLHTYISNGTNMHADSFAFDPYDIWYSADLGGGRWPTGVRGHESHQSLNFLQQCDGTLYLVGTNNDNPVAGEDFADLYRVSPIDGSAITLEYVRTKHVFCESEGGTLCNLAAAGGMYVSPSGELILYGTEHDNDGPGDTVRMGEYRHQDLFEPNSPLWGPTADAGGPYWVPEGGTVALDGSGTRPPVAQAWAELYDDDTFSDRSVVFDYADRNLDDWDELVKIDDFGGRASSAIWTAPPGCGIVLYELNHFAGDSFRLEGDGTVRSIADLGWFSDTTHSARFEGSTCDAADVDLTWDLDGDAHYELPGPTPGFDAASLDGPTFRSATMNACGAFYGCDVDQARINILNVSPSADIGVLLDEQGQAVGEDVDWVLQGLAVRLSGTFTDPGRPDTHTASVDWGDGRSDQHADLESFGDSTGGVTGVASNSHSYAEPGTYTVTFNVTDDDGGVGVATRELRVLSAADALAEVRANLEALAADPFLNPLAKKHLDRAIGRLGGAPGQDGAIDRVRAGTLNAALVMIRDALVELSAAEDLQPGLDLEAEKTLITLSAKSVVMGAIAVAETSTRTDDARVLVAAGDARLSDGDHLGAVDEYRKALTKING